ncbi:hypothetical protein [Streptomyces mirabilis]|uniref:hypothetical protein n=1 Tax=Streptomyces mirabilis TaxID=68239 RepID=UPI0036804DEB
MTNSASTRRTATPAVGISRGDDAVALWASARAAELLRDSEGLPPKYGTAEWQRLPSAAPQKTAAILTAAEMWRRYGDEEDLLAWFREASRPRQFVADGRTLAELDVLAKPKPPHQLRASPGWPPVAIPGRPGWWRHCGPNGEQIDLPHNERSGATAA